MVPHSFTPSQISWDILKIKFALAMQTVHASILLAWMAKPCLVRGGVLADKVGYGETIPP